MYKLTLTREDRKAIDWVGYRYSNGDELYDLLIRCEFVESYIDLREEWISNRNITFIVPEHIAWQIADNARNEDGDFPYNFPCFSDELTSKMMLFCESII